MIFTFLGDIVWNIDYYMTNRFPISFWVTLLLCASVQETQHTMSCCQRETVNAVIANKNPWIYKGQTRGAWNPRSKFTSKERTLSYC
jgi:hypothetical protein